jgi:hypothetical protein
VERDSSVVSSDGPDPGRRRRWGDKRLRPWRERYRLALSVSLWVSESLRDRGVGARGRAHRAACALHPRLASVMPRVSLGCAVSGCTDAGAVSRPFGPSLGAMAELRPRECPASRDAYDGRRGPPSASRHGSAWGAAAATHAPTGFVDCGSRRAVTRRVCACCCQRPTPRRPCVHPPDRCVDGRGPGCAAAAAPSPR